jgi:hypothetical protein
MIPHGRMENTGNASLWGILTLPPDGGWNAGFIPQQRWRIRRLGRIESTSENLRSSGLKSAIRCRDAPPVFCFVVVLLLVLVLEFSRKIEDEDVRTLVVSGQSLSRCGCGEIGFVPLHRAHPDTATGPRGVATRSRCPDNGPFGGIHTQEESSCPLRLGTSRGPEPADRGASPTRSVSASHGAPGVSS